MLFSRPIVCCYLRWSGYDLKLPSRSKICLILSYVVYDFRTGPQNGGTNTVNGTAGSGPTNTNNGNGGNSANLSTEMEQVKQEILSEMRIEMNKLKQDILEGKEC